MRTADGERLLAVARASIEEGLRTGRPLRVRVDDYPEALRAPGASFVTLEKQGHLRGCRGMLQAERPLVEDVALNAFATAFEDPRFPPLDAAELDGIDISLSVLEAPQPLDVHSLRELEQRLRPGVDGLIIDDGRHRATFLPSVWEQLPDPRAFIDQLWRKAGLPVGTWPASLRVQRYGAEKIAGS
ncbi:MAG: AmmeMemoRadiSam system protein A [Pseudomonadales bacterium]|jgi:AmmeMemoRadiSam system protein A|nr:AmmeMemoRadiSam system protein A [Pseudomonadales bacterium]